MQRRWWGAGDDHSPRGHVLSRARLSNASRRVSIAGRCRPLAGCRTSIGPSDTWGQQGKASEPQRPIQQGSSARLRVDAECRAGGSPHPMAPPTAPCTTGEQRAVNAGRSHHPPGERSLGSTSGYNHAEPKCKTVGSRGTPHGILLPGPPEAGGSPSGSPDGLPVFWVWPRVGESAQTGAPARMPSLDFPEAEQERHTEGQQVQP